MIDDAKRLWREPDGARAPIRHGATGFAAIAKMPSPTVVVTQPDAAWAAVTDIMAGKPILVTGGVAALATLANTTSDQWYAEQWRPAIVTRRDGRAMMLIAGSPTGRSTTGAQFARLLVAFGAHAVAPAGQRRPCDRQ